MNRLHVILFILCFLSIAGVSDAAVGEGSAETLELNDDNSSPLWQMLAASVVILALGGIGLVITKKFLPRMASRGSKKISIAETLHLGPKKAVHLLKVGTEFFLISDTRQGLSLLGKVDAEAMDVVETVEVQEEVIQ